MEPRRNGHILRPAATVTDDATPMNRLPIMTSLLQGIEDEAGVDELRLGRDIGG
jgi:hypothetical protein